MRQMVGDCCYIVGLCGACCFPSVGCEVVAFMVQNHVCWKKLSHHSCLSLRCLRAPPSFVAKKVVQPRKPDADRDRRAHVAPDVRKQLLDRYTCSNETMAAHLP